MCAPAGSGKTTLLAGWAGLATARWPGCRWTRPTTTRCGSWRHVVAALDRARPGIAERVGPLLGPPALLSFEGLVTALINDLAAQPGDNEVLLVLDDYHLIDAQPVHVSLGFLLEHLPPGLHLVLASRADLPLPLARLRLCGQPPSCAPPTCASPRLRRQPCSANRLVLTCPPRRWRRWRPAPKGGWPACPPPSRCGGQADPAAFVAAFSGSHRYVLDYLAEEVLDRQHEVCAPSCWKPRCWNACPAGCVMRSPAGTTARRCWSGWNRPACSWCRWMRCAAPALLVSPD